ncbi:hypothetical protein DR864_23470 [Runella rosea]|uniref:histidine kinase n=2 Tax=Runella rosea TaxID=2259595 RepID=A0A344TST6_9BACT|nr:hypothetical protein DR864_23470 [Runella rosea]
MGLLGVEELETSSIYIHNEGAGETECWYAIKDIRGNGINLVSDHMKIHLKDTWVGSKMLAFQHSKKKQTSILMQGQHRKDWINYCAQHSRVLQGYYGDEIPERTYHLVKFSHGFIGVASPGDISNECWNLLQRATSAFSLAYTRFNDLKLAEAQAVQAHLDLIQIQTEKKRAEDTLIELRATQAQLIQKEKLASLGELTAGIAHEIQNPLNFVNNFSELSVDLAQELNEELDKEPIDKVFVKELMGDLTQNQQKINLHGKRASSIVKGMLEHSRQSTGERELTDINQLADEYLRLSYHGLRAKDSSFNCDYALIGARDLPKIEVVPQEIGRVLLNLINNAFYAVNARRAQNAADVNYSPKVVVSTQVIDNQVVIQVKDNGIGMSKEVQAKIFQPFFTTKPTGEGTGLGLSLAYDIVTKGHGGTIELESVEGEGTKFRVGLPIKQQ